MERQIVHIILSLNALSPHMHFEKHVFCIPFITSARPGEEAAQLGLLSPVWRLKVPLSDDH